MVHIVNVQLQLRIDSRQQLRIRVIYDYCRQFTSKLAGCEHQRPETIIVITTNMQSLHWQNTRNYITETTRLKATSEENRECPRTCHSVVTNSGAQHAGGGKRRFSLN